MKNTIREKTFEFVKSNGILRQRLAPYLTEPNDPYFDIFLAIACFSLPEKSLEKLVLMDKLGDKFFTPLKEKSICEIGKGAYSRYFRVFGSKYLAITGPHDPTYPDAPSPQEYKGTIRTELIDLVSFKEHSLYGRLFNITLSHSFLGDVNATHLTTRLQKKQERSALEERGYSLNAIRGMFAIFSQLTNRQGISVHRCDQYFLDRLSQSGYLKEIGFSTEARLQPAIKGGFIDNETIVVLRKS